MILCSPRDDTDNGRNYSGLREWLNAPIQTDDSHKFRENSANDLRNDDAVP